MPHDINPLTEFLIGLGTDDVPHTHDVILTHLVAVYRDLESWKCDEAVCRAGMFHSIYGTEGFQDFTLPLERRSDVREIIGERAEKLAYMNCAMDRASLEEAIENIGPYRVVDRINGDEIELASQELDDLCTVHLCDWLEQVPRVQKWDYRRSAYRAMAERLGGVPLDAYRRVFATEPSPSGVSLY